MLKPMLLTLVLVGCGGPSADPDAGQLRDAGHEAGHDAGADTRVDAGGIDSGMLDAGAAECAPGGKTRFVVTIGSLVAEQRTSWARIGTYTFTCDGERAGTVRSEHWRFNQSSHRHPREYTGVVARDCTPAARDCEMRTAGTWSSLAEPEEQYDGTYAIDGDTVIIEWPGAVRERWTLTRHPSGSLVRLTYAGASGFSTAPTIGFAYGSNAEYATAATMAEVLTAADEASYRFEYAIWNRDAVAARNVRFILSRFSPCEGTECIGMTGCRTLAAGGGGCDLPVDPHWCDPGQSPMMYYISDLPYADRRNNYEFWTLCLADGRGETCYTGNSHTRPMLQIIDDEGHFHGWVGVEMSRGYDVRGDYIGVFRKADF